MIEDFLNSLRTSRRFGVTAAECQRMVEMSLKDPKVKFMIEEMGKSGCSTNPDKFIRVARCPSANGFFQPGEGITICHNYARGQDDVTHTLIHELVHAYDDCRTKNLDWSSCYHTACAEIRAQVLSGACNFPREHYSFSDQGRKQVCVREGAAASVRNDPKCSDYMTKMALRAVWDTCYNDTKPFDKPP